MFIELCLKKMYGRLQGSVSGRKWKSKDFQFKKGVFQGDHLSPLIFLTCFNPILEYCSLKERHGYDLNGAKMISTAYADFNLISTNKRSH